MEIGKTKYFDNREDWRNWLSENYNKEPEIWLLYPNKALNKKRILYNDAVEEALCFGWIDSTLKKYDELFAAQRYTPRRKRSSYSQPNKERLKWLAEKGMIHPEILKIVEVEISKEFLFPEDIMKEIKANKEAWRFYQQQTDSYKRIRVAYIDDTRKRPDEFQKRLQNFINKCAQNKLIKGYGGIEKYY
ncbi:MAG: hypothetical protein HC831_22820 [Chloroflexia bacterium]|nr:hypothetical protein [Chloroflexia bacterium]